MNDLAATGTLTFSHDAAGRETERRVGADVTLAQSWTTTQSLTSTSGATVADHHLQHRTYAYRADGYLTLAERTAPDGRVSTWDYAPDSHRPVGTPTELVSATGDLAWQRRTPSGAPASRLRRTTRRRSTARCVSRGRTSCRVTPHRSRPR